ncbi:GNAT family N-acetyltransferase [Risungbinella massiliensis]|uniref:GNAT family N-acetyltransferase n=1 Tax=Risungbinella massiliensis TaxID=1329796 RepID=UPI0005CC38CE|nr:GNAT family N-acetyltransferase [Risungbinella massiliensis]
MNELQNLTWQKDDFYLSTNKEYLDLSTIHSYLCNDSYWQQGVSIEAVREQILYTPLCYGIYLGNPSTPTRYQVGFARVITDFTRFSYLCDVFVSPDHQGNGLGKWLMECIVETPRIRNTFFSLKTRDAHDLYRQYGFELDPNLDKAMVRTGNQEQQLEEIMKPVQLNLPHLR